MGTLAGSNSGRLAFVADGRSSHTRQWITQLSQRGWDVHLFSTHPCNVSAYPGVVVHPLFQAFRTSSDSAVKALETRSPTHGSSLVQRLAGLASQKYPALRDRIRPVWERLVAAETWPLARKLFRELGRLNADIVHGLRLPIEGYVALLGSRGLCSRVASSWGQDLTYWPSRSRLHRMLTLRSLTLADGFTSDCMRDVRLARTYGLPPNAACLVCPGNGGVETSLFNQNMSRIEAKSRLSIPPDAVVILYARGIGGPFDNFDIFVEAAAAVVGGRTDLRLAIVGAADNVYAQRILEAWHLREQVIEYGAVDRSTMALLMRAASIFVSPSEYDGTPNTLLEAMACGSLPVATDLDSIREWVRPGVNGLVFRVDSATALAGQLRRGLADGELRESAARKNREIIWSRARLNDGIARVESFYRLLIHRRRSNALWAKD